MQEPPTCIARCAARMYYIMGNLNIFRAFVHLGNHQHPVKESELCDMKERICLLIGEQMERTPTRKNFAIVLEATKELLGECELGICHQATGFSFFFAFGSFLLLILIQKW